MNALKFEFGNAAFHFNRTGGPPGFLWKFGLTYAAAVILLAAITTPLFWPMIAASFNPATANDPEALADAMLGSIGTILLGYLVTLVLSVVIWAMFESASQRRYVRGDGFGLRFGADELRLLAVGFFWFLIFLGLYIATLIMVMVPTVMMGVAASNGDASYAGPMVLLLFVMMLVMAVVSIWVCARLSPAAALTIRDKRIRFFSAWGVTKGKVWTLVGSWIVLWLIGFAVFLVFYLVLAVAMFGVFGPLLSSAEATEEEFVAALTSPVTLAIIAVVTFVIYALYGAFMHIFSGPAALVAKTDPAWAGGVTDTFV